MRNRAVGAVLKGVRTLLDVGTSTGLSDGQLLERYLLRGDDSAEAAFRALVERMARWCSAPAVGCFMTSMPPRMPSRPRSSSWRERPGRSASGTRSRAGSSASRVGSRGGRTLKPAAAGGPRETGGRDDGSDGRSSSDRRAGTVPEVQEEVDRLPERYRAPIVLCYLEGLTQEEAAMPAPPAGQHGPGAADAGAVAAARPADPPRTGPGRRSRDSRPVAPRRRYPLPSWKKPSRPRSGSRSAGRRGSRPRSPPSWKE